MPMFVCTKPSSCLFFEVPGLLSFPFSKNKYCLNILDQYISYSEDQETVYSAIFLKYNTHPCILIEEWFA